MKTTISLWKIFTLIFILFLFATQVPQTFQNHSLSLVSASSITGTLSQYTIYQYGNTFTAQQYADYTDAFQISYDANSTIVNQIHTIEPSFIGLVYRNVVKISESTSAEWREFTTRDWILKDAAGAYPYETRFNYYFADIGNPDYQQWVSSWIYNQTTKKGASGVFCDGGLSTYAAELWEYASSPPINPRTGTHWTDQEVRDAYVGLYNSMRAKLGSAQLIVVNGIWSGSRLLSRPNAYMDIFDRTSINGIMGEGWWRDFLPQSPWYTESRWKSSLDALISLENNFIKGSPSRLFIPGCYVENGDASVPLGATTTQIARYGYASTLLGIQSSRNYLLLTLDQNRLQDYSNHYFSLDVGVPTGNYTLISGTHVYQRPFSKAIVIVNPTSTSYSISLAGQYKNLNGTIVSGTYIVPAYTGEVLMFSLSKAAFVQALNGENVSPA